MQQNFKETQDKEISSTQDSDEFYCCEWINSGLHFSATSLCFCCNSSQSIGDHPHILDQYNGEFIDENILHKIKKIKERFKEGKFFKNCQYCSHLIKRKWDGLEKQYFNHFIFTNTYKCNLKCIYCFTNDLSEDELNKSYNVYPIIKNLYNAGLIKFSNSTNAVFSGGEPTISTDFDNLLNLFIDNDCSDLKVHSSGIVLSQSVLKGIEKGYIDLIISPDAGTKETYLQVKRVDAFDKVMYNIKKYIQKSKKAEQVRSKFIVMPDVNDNKEEINSWFQQMLNCGVKYVICDIEQHWFYEHRNDKKKKLVDLLDYFKQKAEEYKLTYEYYPVAQAFMNL